MKEETCQALVLITKGVRDYYGIGLVEVVLKVVMDILNFRFIDPTTFYDTLHGLHASSGTGTASLEANLLQ